MMRYPLIAIIAALGFTGCKDPLHNYDECVDIETARCNLRENCVGNTGFDKEFPDFDVDTCIAYAKEHCRTRKIGSNSFKQEDVEACIEEIAKVPCESLSMNTAETGSIPLCDFLNPTEEETETQSVTESVSADDTGTLETDSDSAS